MKLMETTHVPETLSPVLPRNGFHRDFRRIAVEEAFVPPSLARRYLQMLEDGSVTDRGFRSLWGCYGGREGALTTGVLERIQNLGERRIADMDATGVDLQ